MGIQKEKCRQIARERLTKIKREKEGGRCTHRKSTQICRQVDRQRLTERQWRISLSYT